MKFQFKDNVTGEIMIEVASPNTEFACNIFNLFMVEMVRMHGPAFKKISEVLSYPKGVVTVNMDYTCNISGKIEP